MSRKNLKRSSKHPFFLYSVIYGVGIAVSLFLLPVVYAEGKGTPIENMVKSLRDPFRPSVRVSSTKYTPIVDLEAEQKMAEEARRQAELLAQTRLVVVKPTLPPLIVTGIVFNTEHPQAIINGKVVEVGNLIDDVRIDEIKKGSVVVLYMDTEFTLNFNNE